MVDRGTIGVGSRRHVFEGVGTTEPIPSSAVIGDPRSVRVHGSWAWSRLRWHLDRPLWESDLDPESDRAQACPESVSAGQRVTEF